MKGVKEIDEEIRELKNQKPSGWIKKVIDLRKERNLKAAQIGIKKK